MALQTGLNDTTPIRYTIGKFTDAAGNPSLVDPTMPVTRVAISDPAVARLVNQSADLLSGEIERVASGIFQVQADVDVDTGTGVETITLLSETVEILSGKTVTGTIDLAIG